MIPNHYAAKLSDLDMQIVRCVPPGGNWKNIPESVPSRRLEQIRASYRAGMGSRSTYYGRLLPHMPSYTINTYFTRPGNGCHIHYEQARTLSQREAARLQSFPDSFAFQGSLASVNKQIGNAVPPLLAYQIARALPVRGLFVDLFCGAGGLALGFVWAGWRPIVGNDINADALATHTRNIGAYAVLGDINSEDAVRSVAEACDAARRGNPGVPVFVLGGPPCQGFSTANARHGAADTRNWLFRGYVRVLRMVRPDGFLFENVKGILNMDGGSFFAMIQDELSHAAEDVRVHVFNSAHFGIPQRRERVVILGGSRELASAFRLSPITSVGNERRAAALPRVPSVEDALSDLPPIEQAEDGSAKAYRTAPQTAYQRLMREMISPEEYLRLTARGNGIGG